MYIFLLLFFVFVVDEFNLLLDGAVLRSMLQMCPIGILGDERQLVAKLLSKCIYQLLESPQLVGILCFNFNAERGCCGAQLAVISIPSPLRLLEHRQLCRVIKLCLLVCSDLILKSCDFALKFLDVDL